MLFRLELHGDCLFLSFVGEGHFDGGSGGCAALYEGAELFDADLRGAVSVDFVERRSFRHAGVGGDGRWGHALYYQVPFRRARVFVERKAETLEGARRLRRQLRPRRGRRGLLRAQRERRFRSRRLAVSRACAFGYVVSRGRDGHGLFARGAVEPVDYRQVLLEAGDSERAHWVAGVERGGLSLRLPVFVELVERGLRADARYYFDQMPALLFRGFARGAADFFSAALVVALRVVVAGAAVRERADYDPYA